MMRFLRQPLDDVMNGLERCLVRGPSALVFCFAGLAAAWWLYVPIHELLHVAGCEIGGGRVWRLELDPLYGGALLARWFPFIEPGGEYAGRLSGFDTGGSALVHLLTTGLPFALTIFPGVWLLRWGARRTLAWLFGAALVVALAPFVSLTGDAYEFGSLLATRVPPWSTGVARTALVGDDIAVVADGLAGAGATLWVGFVLAALLGVVWAFATYTAGAAVATLLGQPVVERLPRAARDAAPGDGAGHEKAG